MSSNPRVVAIIPARGGSKGIPRKNLEEVGGLPLLARAILSCKQVADIDQVWVSTDDMEIAALANSYGAKVINRPKELASDTASSESAILHALDIKEQEGQIPQVLAFVQTTSPFIESPNLATAINMVLERGYSSVFSAFESHAFIWEEDTNGATGVNHDSSVRQRRQDRQPNFFETGAFYVMDAKGFRAASHRFFGKIGIAKVSESFAIEIDTPEQLEVARQLAPYFKRVGIPPGSIRAIAMDFDGVHTDDLVHVSQDGFESVTVSRSDGMGIELLKKAGIPLIILSKEKNPVVLERAKKLGVPAINALNDKVSSLLTWASEEGIALEHVAYVGNDVNDLECLKLVGWPIVPSDCNPSIRRFARVVLSKKGGAGAIRELADLVLETE